MDAEWLAGILKGLEYFVEEDDPEYEEMRYFLFYMGQLAKSPLRNTEDGRKYKRLILQGAPKWVKYFNLRGPMAYEPRSHWWWYLPDLVAGKIKVDPD